MQVSEEGLRLVRGVASVSNYAEENTRLQKQVQLEDSSARDTGQVPTPQLRVNVGVLRVYSDVGLVLLGYDVLIVTFFVCEDLEALGLQLAEGHLWGDQSFEDYHVAVTCDQTVMDRHS